MPCAGFGQLLGVCVLASLGGLRPLFLLEPFHSCPLFLPLLGHQWRECWILVRISHTPEVSLILFRSIFSLLFRSSRFYCSIFKFSDPFICPLYSTVELIYRGLKKISVIVFFLVLNFPFLFAEAFYLFAQLSVFFFFFFPVASGAFVIARGNVFRMAAFKIFVV